MEVTIIPAEDAMDEFIEEDDNDDAAGCYYGGDNMLHYHPSFLRKTTQTSNP